VSLKDPRVEWTILALAVVARFSGVFDWIEDMAFHPWGARFEPSRCCHRQPLKLVDLLC